MKTLKPKNINFTVSHARPVHRRPQLRNIETTSQLKRSFHATSNREFTLNSVVEGACSTIFNSIDLLHSSTGLSWVITLPLTAVFVRTFVVLPVSLWGHHHRNKIAEVNPIIHAWKPALQKQIIQKDGHLGPQACHRLLIQAMRSKRKELYKHFGLKLWPAYHGLFQLPVWLLCIETIRKMCGMPEGLLGLITKSLPFADVETGVETVTSSVPL
ncbi:MAG: hypothetical protein MMC23_000575, partial [Stictis urceolatum]|nr:hypothetical protein [Stictis urceolata]